jgi:hypothetical protein
MDIYKFGNKYLPSANKMQFEFRSHFLGKKCVLEARKYSSYLKKIHDNEVFLKNIVLNLELTVT